MQNSESDSVCTFLQKQASLFGISAKQAVESQVDVLYPSEFPMEVDSTQENGSSGGQAAVTDQIDSKEVSTMSCGRILSTKHKYYLLLLSFNFGTYANEKTTTQFPGAYYPLFMFQVGNISWYCNRGKLSMLNMWSKYGNVVSRNISGKIKSKSVRSPFTTSDNTAQGTSSLLKINGIYGRGLESKAFIAGVSGTVSFSSNDRVYTPTSRDDVYDLENILNVVDITTSPVTYPATFCERLYIYCTGFAAGTLGLTSASGKLQKIHLTYRCQN